MLGDPTRRDVLRLSTVGMVSAIWPGNFVRPAWAVRLAPPFDETHYVRIDSWRVDRSQASNVRQAVAERFGRQWSAVRVGLAEADWRAVCFDTLPHVVVPVTLIASDRRNDHHGVALGLQRYRSALAQVAGWYRDRVGATFRMLRPIVIVSRYTSADWHSICDRTRVDAERGALVDAAEGEYRRELPPPGENVRVVLAPYTGNSPEVWLGAASRGAFAIVPPFATSHQIASTHSLTERQRGVLYAIGHELGHTFGLSHTRADHPNDPRGDQSIMEQTAPPEAILFPEEIEHLRRSSFFCLPRMPAGARFVDRQNYDAWLGHTVRLESLNLPGHFVRHRFGLGEVTRLESELDRQDATFRMVAGLSDAQYPCISLESTNYPEHYLRHRDFRIHLDHRDTTTLFGQDATFRLKTGLASPHNASLEASNKPGHYIRHYDFHLKIAKENTPLFHQDATYRIELRD